MRICFQRCGQGVGKLTTRQYPGATHSVTTPRPTGPVQGGNQPKIKGLREEGCQPEPS